MENINVAMEEIGGKSKPTLNFIRLNMVTTIFPPIAVMGSKVASTLYTKNKHATEAIIKKVRFNFILNTLIS